VDARGRRLLIAAAVFVLALVLAGVARRAIDQPESDASQRATFVAACVGAGGEVVPGVCGCTYDSLYSVDDGRSLEAVVEQLDRSPDTLPDDAIRIVEGCVIAARGATASTDTAPTSDTSGTPSIEVVPG